MLEGWDSDDMSYLGFVWLFVVDDEVELLVILCK